MISKAVTLRYKLGCFVCRIWYGRQSGINIFVKHTVTLLDRR